ncbi:predicted protein [Naegleria gruberi]|uniref:Predicted protein n=1 Tax=Naegleria gruberi TaxID=5762 RepID=D2VLF8_NAEGR|nr:uncharacterized protein NAEGRDRAFT_50526 [Naegleria gruberi]EFC42305.1 predicted protein [Naegleria gruberi]|eukprot:XP_002675049.1 predicted protein [Naegleria gruberi strain NEG-M]
MAIESPNKLSIKIQDDGCGIVFFSKEKDDRVEVKFHRTIRLPEDDKSYPLPSSMGLFAIEKVDDYLETVPEDFKKHGGVFICIQQREALRMEFVNTNIHFPHALKIASGKINVLSGEEWDERIIERPVQDYIVSPMQKRLDGINCGGFRKVKQFVAMPLGKGYTLEGQLSTNEEESIGGIQIICFNSDSKKREEKFGQIIPTKPTTPKKPIPTNKVVPPTSSVSKQPPMVKSLSVKQKKSTQPTPSPRSTGPYLSSPSSQRRSASSNEKSGPEEMGIAPGGSMKQTLVADPYTPQFWDEQSKARIFVHLVNTKMYTQITGKRPTVSPISKETYLKLNYPWYEHYVEESGTIPSSEILSDINTVKETDVSLYGKSKDSTTSITVGKIIKKTTSIEKADFIPPPLQTKSHAFRDILPREIVFHIATFLTVPPLNRLARCDRYLLDLFFNLTVPKVYLIQKRKQEFKQQGIETAIVSMKDIFKEDEDSLVQKLVWKPMVLFYFPSYQESLNIKNWMHVLRRRVTHLMKKCPTALPLTKQMSTDAFKVDMPTKDRRFIENCEWEYECPLKTTDLKEASTGVRYCHVCKEKVYEVFTKEDFKSHISQDHCVMVTTAPQRRIMGKIRIQ